MYYYYIVLLLIIILIPLIIILGLWCKDTISQTSPLLISLRQLNNTYHFHVINSSYTYSINLQSKTKFDKYNTDVLFKELLLSNYNLWKTIQQQLAENVSLWQKYSQALQNLLSCSPEIKHSPIPKVIWDDLEKQLFNQEKLSPVIYSEIICLIHYTSPKGRNSYTKRNLYSFDIIDEWYYKIQQQHKAEQNMKYLRKKERNKLSSKLRYKILERDHHRCQICGRSVTDGVKLHVDHIKPIAKGGLTIESNLRTLCEDCNWGKSDEYEE